MAKKKKRKAKGLAKLELGQLEQEISEILIEAETRIMDQVSEFMAYHEFARNGGIVKDRKRGRG
jgi:hypothetical protein